MIYIDVTHTLATGLRTGTQRVVRQIVRHVAAPNPSMGDGGAAEPVGCAAVAAVDGRFHHLSEIGWRELLQPSRTTSSEGGTGGVQQRIGALLRRVPPAFDRFQLWNFNRRIRPGLIPMIDPAPIEPGAGDAVVLVDAFWGGTTTMTAATRAFGHGAVVIPMVHDMIPVTHPAMVHPATAITYARRLRRSFAAASGILANSRFTADETRRFLTASGIDLPVDNFRLGHDLGTPVAAPAGRPGAFAYVMVGTIEPRKGHMLVLDAFERLWADGSEASLTFIGKMGWAEPALKERCRSHAQLGRRLFVHHDLSDADLRRALTTADAAILASVVEGFGLPLVESLSLDLPVIAADIPVFREVGGHAALYFRGGDPAALVAAIHALERDPAAWRARASAFRWPDWAEAADEFLAAVARLRTAGGQPTQ